MPGWGDAIRDAKDKETADAVQQQIEEWERQRERGTNDKGKYGENPDEDLTTPEGKKKYRERVRKESDVATNNARSHAVNVQNDTRNHWSAQHNGYTVDYYDGIPFYTKGGRTYDQKGNDCTADMP